MISQEPLQIPQEQQAMRRWIEQNVRFHFLDLQELSGMSSSPTQIYIKATNQSEGNLHLSDADHWATSKAQIKQIRVFTDSSNWDLWLLQNDNGYAANDATIPRLKIAHQFEGDDILLMDLPYEDEDASEELHLYWIDNSGSNTATFIIKGIKNE